MRFANVVLLLGSLMLSVSLFLYGTAATASETGPAPILCTDQNCDDGCITTHWTVCITTQSHDKCDNQHALICSVSCKCSFDPAFFCTCMLHP
jgi:hypothetical protein